VPAIPRWIGCAVAPDAADRVFRPASPLTRHQPPRQRSPAARPASCGRTVSGLDCTRMIKPILMPVGTHATEDDALGLQRLDRRP
jgi:hypothetical protein